jgi:hypothetical protein
LWNTYLGYTVELVRDTRWGYRIDEKDGGARQMTAGMRLALYGLGLAVAFGGAYWLADAIVPESVVTAWVEGSDTHADDHESGR